MRLDSYNLYTDFALYKYIVHFILGSDSTPRYAGQVSDNVRSDHYKKYPFSASMLMWLCFLDWDQVFYLCAAEFINCVPSFL